MEPPAQLSGFPPAYPRPSAPAPCPIRPPTSATPSPIASPTAEIPPPTSRPMSRMLPPTLNPSFLDPKLEKTAIANNIKNTCSAVGFII